MGFPVDGFGLGVLAGLAIGAAVAAWWWRQWGQSARVLAARLAESEARVLAERLAASEARVNAGRERHLDETADGLREAFRALSAETLERVEARLREVVKLSTGGQVALAEQVKALASAQGELSRETAMLARALRTPGARGRWGELQLRRVIELAGMVQHCDFVEQAAVGDGRETRRGRPDVLVRLPGEGLVAVDAKAPLEAYLAASEASDELVRRQALVAHARAVRMHARALAGRDYVGAIAGAGVDFVVMFLPGEAFFAAALEGDPTLVESLAGERVVLATPTTLIALLRTVALAWRQEHAAAQVREVAVLTSELHERLRSWQAAWEAVRGGIEQASRAWSRANQALETRVWPAVRRLRGETAEEGRSEEERRESGDAERTTATCATGTSQ